MILIHLVTTFPIYYIQQLIDFKAPLRVVKLILLSHLNRVIKCIHLILN